MVKATKLPSGSWNCKVYSHTEKVVDPKTGKLKDHRIYESFTSSTPGAQGKREVEAQAAQFIANKTKPGLKKKHDYGKMTLREACEKYIERCRGVNRSPTTVQDYECILRNGFQDLMDLHLKELDEGILQDAVNLEATRQTNGTSRHPLSAKRLKNEWGLISATLNKYWRYVDLREIELPQPVQRIPDLPEAKDVIRIIRGTPIELPVLLAAWLSFSMSEVRGLTKSKSVRGNYLAIVETVVDVHGGSVRKEYGKNPARIRQHRIPAYIMELINRVEGDNLVEMSGKALYHRWIRLQQYHGMQPITFHDLRHLNASVMALLQIPEKYALERGGWKTDHVMKNIYIQTFKSGRIHADDVMDEYFESIMQHEMQHELKKAL